MAISKSKFKNILFFIVIGLLIIPQTRKPIQVFLQKGIALFGPSLESSDDLKKITDYNWLLKDENQETYNFQSAKGKVILVNFWATWCPPCIAEMPSMQKLYNDYKDKVEFLFVTSDDFTEINTFLNDNNYTFKVYQPATQYPEYFDVTTIPRTFLINQSGQIIIDESRSANWNSDKVRMTIDNLLKASGNE
ncbi:TlpA family protein disulfide reductase [Aestuariibaculum marinum]|uniref:TlpA family protein disulfide reductase n=1 Tax=Aestuariibaculum marinum TaxID=2683592 RepID=A0A8J6Q4F8_9FLAO|nr:TlpA disulfide reductase family protein [Aestuariibaculum marinum]MBD0824079.1 TlpA family protein disulfide reductase [Aestuariibaculum marinum]